MEPREYPFKPCASIAEEIFSGENEELIKDKLTQKYNDEKEENKERETMIHQQKYEIEDLKKSLVELDRQMKEQIKGDKDKEDKYLAWSTRLVQAGIVEAKNHTGIGHPEGTENNISIYEEKLRQARSKEKITIDRKEQMEYYYEILRSSLISEYMMLAEVLKKLAGTNQTGVDEMVKQEIDSCKENFDDLVWKVSDEKLFNMRNMILTKALIEKERTVYACLSNMSERLEKEVKELTDYKRIMETSLEWVKQEKKNMESKNSSTTFPSKEVNNNQTGKGGPNGQHGFDIAK